MRWITKRTSIRVSVFLVVVALTVTSYFAISSDVSNAAVDRDYDFVLSFSGYGTQQGFEVSIANADTIVKATVVRSGESRWTTSDGIRPDATAEEVLRNSEWRIVTPYDLIIESDYGQRSSGQTIRIWQEGGTVGNVKQVNELNLSPLSDGFHGFIFLSQQREAVHSDLNSHHLVSAFEIDPTNDRVKTALGNIEMTEAVQLLNGTER